jgi:predicted ester cyclase
MARLLTRVIKPAIIADRVFALFRKVPTKLAQYQHGLLGGDEIMTIEQNKSVVQRYFEAFNAGDLEILESLTSPEMFQYSKDNLDWVAATFADHRLEIRQIIAEGNEVAVRVDSSGRHIGEWMDITPTGKSWNNYGVVFFRLQSGKIIDIWMLFDVPNHVKELGGEIKVVTQ